MRALGRCCSGLVLAVLSASTPSAADEDPVVVTVGKTTVRASELSRRLATLPPVQLHSLGETPETIRRRYVQSVLVPELLYGEAARERRLAEAPWVQSRVREVYHRALRDELTREAIEKEPIADEAIAAYYEEHHAEFHKEERLLLWRILVDDEATAKRIIGEARGVGGPERWRALAREHSRDTATHLRGGVLGFVGPDGSTDVPQLRAEPALYEAARGVADGEIVSEPVPEGESLAVVWRRGTRPATGRSLDEARAHITEILRRKRTTDALTALLKELRTKRLSEHHPELTEQLPAADPEALVPGRRPPTPSAATPTGSVAPARVDGKLR